MIRHKHILIVLAALFSWFVACTPAVADSYKNVDTSSAQEIVDAMAAKGVRGAANLLTGWVEIPKQIHLTGEKDGWMRGTVIGPFKGIGMAVVRTVSGAGELLTFFVAYPGFFDPWFEPRFVWQDE